MCQRVEQRAAATHCQSCATSNCRRDCCGGSCSREGPRGSLKGQAMFWDLGSRASQSGTQYTKTGHGNFTCFSCSSRRVTGQGFVGPDQFVDETFGLSEVVATGERMSPRVACRCCGSGRRMSSRVTCWCYKSCKTGTDSARRRIWSREGWKWCTTFLFCWLWWI